MSGKNVGQVVLSHLNVILKLCIIFHHYYAKYINNLYSRLQIGNVPLHLLFAKHVDDVSPIKSYPLRQVMLITS